MASSPTRRSLEHMRKLGYTVEVTERWNAHVGIRQDLFSFIDIVALGSDLVGVQTTSTTNVSKRIAKITDLEVEKVDKATGAKSMVPNKVRANALAWLGAGGKILVHGWAKRGARKQPKLWTLKEVTLTVADFEKKPTVCIANGPKT